MKRPINDLKVMLALAGITQAELAEIMEKSQSNISAKIARFGQGKGSIEFAYEVARICGYKLCFVPVTNET